MVKMRRQAQGPSLTYYDQLEVEVTVTVCEAYPGQYDSNDIIL